MTTKPRTTKKPAAKPKRYFRVAVKAGKATLQESDKPNRGFKPQRKARLKITPDEAIEELGRRAAMAEAIGCGIADALGRRLENLLAKPDNPGFDAVSARPVEKLGDGVTGCRANYATESTPSRISPIEEALQRLRGEIAAAEVTTDIEMEKLEAGGVLALVQPAPGGVGPAQQPAGSGQLASVLNAFAERLAQENRRRANMLDRLEL